MTGNETNRFRIGVGGNESKTEIVVAERLHALDICATRADEGNAAVFQIALERSVRNAAARQFQHLFLDFLELIKQYRILRLIADRMDIDISNDPFLIDDENSAFGKTLCPKHAIFQS